ncbi:MAG TPA: WD40 repeat domain-containing serine/threonine-protein kinase, partial [Gemmataceae bacterium]
RWAVKCFTREVHGLRERYSEIGKYLRLANLPFMVDFKYLEQGIRVRGQWYPILKMQWVEGFVLNEFVRDNLDKKSILQALGQIWLRMAKRLRESYIAHCDLQHGNVMFVPGSNANSLAVKLIDYDGMCVPSLAGTKSGEVGHPAYQHPERLRTGVYNQEVDRFSLLSIATALRCLAVGGRSLWERYDNGDNLLFRQSDLQAPAESPLFQELLTIGDAPAQTLVKELYRACQGSLDGVPLLTDLMPEEKPAGKATKTASPPSSALVQQPAVAQGPDWDFNNEDAGDVVVAKRRSTGKMPRWAWGAIGGAAAVLILGAGVGVGLALRNSSTKKTETPVARSKPKTDTPKPPLPEQRPLAANGGADNPPEPRPDNPKPMPIEGPPPNSNDKPNEVKPPQPPAEQPPPEFARPMRIFQMSPSGDMLAMSGEGDKTWRLVNPRTNEMIRTFTGHEGAITAAAFSADGQRVLTGSEDQSVRLWDVQTGETIRTIPARAPVVVVALSPDGRQGVVINSRDLRSCNLRDFETGRGHGYGFARRPTCLAFAPDNQAFLAGLDQGDKDLDQVMMIWKLPPDHGIRSFRGRPEPVTCVALSADGKYAVSGHSGETPCITLWEVSTGKPLWQNDMSARPIRQAVFSPDSRFLLAGADTAIRLFHVPGGQPAGKFDVPKETPVCACFSSDSKQALCASYEDGKVRLQSLDLMKGDVASPPPVVVEKPPRQPEGQKTWSHLDIPRDIAPAAKDDVLRIPSGHTVATRQEYNGALDITIELRGTDHDVSFIAPGGAMATFRYRGKMGHVLNVRRPDARGGEFGNLVGKGLPIALAANQWYTLHWEIKSTGMKIALDKQLLFQETHAYNLTSKYPVKIRVNAAAIELKSLVVKKLKK